MGLFVEDLCSSVIVTHVLYKAALAIALLRWALSWAIRLRNRTQFSSSLPAADDGADDLAPPQDQPCCSSTQLVRDSLILTTFGEVADRFPGCPCDTCAVCLSQFRPRDEVRELRNCSHVFHRACLDTWLDHDRLNQTCPLCRSPFLTESQSRGLSSAAARSQQPSWAVERLLYLFGDDLLL